MHNQTDYLDQADEEILTCTVSDETLEAIGTGGGGRAISLISTANRCIVC
jgi:hypothetical protein